LRLAAGAVVQTTHLWGQLGLRELAGNYQFEEILVSGTSDRGFKSHPPHQKPTRHFSIGNLNRAE